MRPPVELQHEFVETIPRKLAEGVLYISIPYATAAHLCFCGCGSEINTPLSPTDWRLIFDGRSVSLYPSIGNWSLPCRSHYWIDRDRIGWARQMSQAEITAGRVRDRLAKDRYFGESQTVDHVESEDQAAGSGKIIRRVRKLLATTFGRG